jgi:hypothetical protein
LIQVCNYMEAHYTFTFIRFFSKIIKFWIYIISNLDHPIFEK